MSYTMYELPNGKKELINFTSDSGISNALDIVSCYCGNDIAKGLNTCINDLKNRADYEMLKFNSDFEAYEAENEVFTDALNEIESILQQYEYKLDDGQEKFSRKRILKLFNEIHSIISGCF